MVFEDGSARRHVRAHDLLDVGQVDVGVGVFVAGEAAVVADLLVRDLVVAAEVSGARLVRAVEPVVSRVAHAEPEVAVAVLGAVVVAVVDVVRPEVVEDLGFRGDLERGLLLLDVADAAVEHEEAVLFDVRSRVV